MFSRWTQVCPFLPLQPETLTYRLTLSDFEKANEIYFRLGIIYKHQRKFSASLEVSFRRPCTTVSDGSLIISASDISSTTLLDPSPRTISGSSWVTYMSRTAT